MASFDSAEERRRAFRRELADRVTKCVAGLQKAKTTPVFKVLKVAQVPQAPTTTLLPHDHTRNGARLINWNDPEDIAYVHAPAGGSDVFTGQRNMVEAVLAHDEALRATRAEYERKCQQDEARIHNSHGNPPYISDARIGWWDRMQTK